MSSNDQAGLGVAVILWRRRWLAIGVAVLIVAVALPWGLERSRSREILVRIPRIDRAPVASAVEITAEVRMAIAPELGCSPAEAAALGVEEAGGLAKLTQAIPPDADAGEVAELDERLQGMAGMLDRMLSSRLAKAIERLDVEILAFEAQLQSLREAPAEFVESGDAPAAYARLVGSRASAEPGGIVDGVRDARVSGRMARLLAIGGLAVLAGVLTALGVDMLLAARSIARSSTVP